MKSTPTWYHSQAFFGAFLVLLYFFEKAWPELHRPSRVTARLCAKAHNLCDNYVQEERLIRTQKH